MHVLRFIPILIAWLPHVLAGVVLVESVVSSSTPGEQKKRLVLDYLRSTADKLGLTWGDSAIRALDLLIDASVTILNIVGGFKHKQQEEPDVAEAKESGPTKHLINIRQRSSEDPELEGFLEKMKVE